MPDPPRGAPTTPPPPPRKPIFPPPSTYTAPTQHLHSTHSTHIRANREPAQVKGALLDALWVDQQTALVQFDLT